MPKIVAEFDLQEPLHSTTLTLEALSSVANDEVFDDDSSREERILLVGRPRSLRKWEIRWLQRSGFELTLVDKAEHVLATAKAVSPHFIFVEAAFKDANKRPVYLSLFETLGADTPMTVIASSSSEASIAMDHGVFDVARKPFDWRLLSRRTRSVFKMLRQQADLGCARESLKSAIALADRIREHTRATESFEPVTGLPTRTKFDDLLQRSAKLVSPNKNSLITMVVGLNRFNLIAETLGSEVSDQLASVTADILRDCVDRTADSVVIDHGLRTASVARVGPGKFAIMMTGSPNADELHNLQRMVLARLGEPQVVDGQTLYLSPCIGAAVFPRDVENPAHLLLKTESAMRDARACGMPFRHHSVKLDEEIARRLDIENRLHAAIEQSQLVLAYQPLVDVESDRIVGCEALLRWPQADGSFISPAEFVPIAEDSGLMIKIGEFVLRTACLQLSEWSRKGIGPIRMSVNVSKCQLNNERFLGLVGECVDEYDIDPKYLDLELSERGTLTTTKDIIHRLRSLKELGVSLSIDDFGTGEAAISYLKDLPVDVLKIDRSYIAELKSDGTESAITSAIVALGQRLNMTVVAEGVESDEQLALIRGMGCDQYQGFYRSPAITPEQLADLMQVED